LAREAAQIPMGQVVRLIDGPLAPIGCVSQTAYERCSCPDEVHCGLRMLMLDVRNAIAGILDRYSFGGCGGGDAAQDAPGRHSASFQPTGSSGSWSRLAWRCGEPAGNRLQPLDGLIAVLLLPDDTI
jgi:hypothetical protein